MVILDDNRGYLGLTDHDQSKCFQCWSEDEIANFTTWDDRHLFNYPELSGRFKTLPFRLTEANYCALQCEPGYWSNFKSSHSAAIDTTHQRCNSDNCKNWDYTVLDENSVETDLKNSSASAGGICTCFNGIAYEVGELKGAPGS
jgi:hypothetical protein